MPEFTLDKLPRSVLAKIDFQTAFMASRCVIAAERLHVFRKLSGKTMTAAELGRASGISARRRDFFFAALHALGLLRKSGNRYANTALAERHFVHKRSVHWTNIYASECAEEFRAFAVLDEMLTTGRNYEEILGIRRQYYFELMQTNPKWAWGFTHMLYEEHKPEAAALAKSLNLKAHRRVLDVGGGSGVMSMALVRKNPGLHACVLDIPNVIRAARAIIRKEKLARRVATRVGDMNDSMPSGFDVVMFCDHARLSDHVLTNALNCLPSGGLLVWADYFGDEDFDVPLTRLMWQLRSSDPHVTTRRSAKQQVCNCGFTNVRCQHLVGHTWLLTGKKP